MRIAQLFVSTMTVLIALAPVTWSQEQAAWLSPEIGNAKLTTSYSFTSLFNEPVVALEDQTGAERYSQEH